jgi:hypothetical protein
MSGAIAGQAATEVLLRSPGYEIDYALSAASRKRAAASAFASSP